MELFEKKTKKKLVRLYIKKHPIDYPSTSRDVVKENMNRQVMTYKRR